MPTSQPEIGLTSEDELQSQPICASCNDPIDGEVLVYQAACGHQGCPSMCWHPKCLMDWRERQAVLQAAQERAERIAEEFFERLRTPDGP